MVKRKETELGEQLMKSRKTVIVSFMMLLGLIFDVVAKQDIMTDSLLNARQKNMISIASLTSTGNLQELKPAIHTGLDNELTVNEMKEVMIHLYAYCGFPRSIRGLQTLMMVLDERKSKGIIDKLGSPASAIKETGNKYDRGKAILENLTGVHETGTKTGYAAFAPEIEVFLKEHLFADIFERDVLTHAERELVTIAVLSSIGGVEPMLKSHLTICLNVGLTPAQLQQFIGIIKQTIGTKEAIAAQKVLNEVLNNRK